MFLALTTELLRDGYGVRFHPQGQSMHPTIRDGEAVTIEPVKALDVRRGDILLYQTARGVIAHRVTRIRQEKNPSAVFTMRGDAPLASAEEVDANKILGRVISVERGERTIDLASRSVRLRQRARLCAARLKNRARAIIL
jgi:signal peptidase I